MYIFVTIYIYKAWLCVLFCIFMQKLLKTLAIKVSDVIIVSVDKTKGDFTYG